MMRLIELTNARRQQPVWINPAQIAYLEADMGRTLISFAATLAPSETLPDVLVVEETPAQIAALLERIGS